MSETPPAPAVPNGTEFPNGTESPNEAPTAAEGPHGADYAILALVCATAAFAGLIEVLLVPLYVGGSIFPVTVALGMATTYALPRLGIWLTRTVRGAVLPMVAWLIAVLGLGFYPRPEGDVIVVGGNSEQWVMFALVIAGAVVGFGTVVRASVPS